MTKHILPAFKLTIIAALFLAVLYPMVVLASAQLFPDKGQGKTIYYKEKKYYTNIGQHFNNDAYFWSRPSAVAYNAAGSGGSNKGPTNEAYLEEVKARIDTFMSHNPEVKKSEIPVDMVTASGSGLDPHISIDAAKVQVPRIAKLNGIKNQVLLELIEEQTERPLAGLFGPSKINVLQLNIALDKLITANLNQ